MAVIHKTSYGHALSVGALFQERSGHFRFANGSYGTQTLIMNERQS